MMSLRAATRRMLVLRSGEHSCAVDGGDLVAIDHDGGSARIAIDGPPRDLTAFLPETAGAGSPIRLIVQAAGRRHGFRTCADVELVEISTAFQLPRLVRELGCTPWIHGVVLVPGANDDEERPTVWLDLVGLATATHQEIERR